MSQGYKFKYDEMKQGNPAEKETVKAENQTFAENTHVHNLCFIWPDNRKKFLNYAYLISGEYLPTESKIILSFTSDTVEIKGLNLSNLFDELIYQIPLQIVCIEKRYSSLLESKDSIIEEITIVQK